MRWLEIMAGLALLAGSLTALLAGQFDRAMIAAAALAVFAIITKIWEA